MQGAPDGAAAGGQDDLGRRAAKLRAYYARCVAVLAGTGDPRIEEAFAAVPREPFAGPAPWFVPLLNVWHPGPWQRTYVQTPDDDPAFLYQNVMVALDAERGLHNGEPSLHARCLDALAVQPGETVVHVGAGSGYYTAILAHLAGPDGRVHAFEIDSGLAARAACNLVPWLQAVVHARSGAMDGLPDADAVYVNAGITQPSRPWLDALRPGGRLMFPLQPEGGYGGMLLVQRPGGGAPGGGAPGGGAAWPARFVSRAGFVACQAQQDEVAGRGLAAAFAGGGWDRVQSFRIGGILDETCWFDGGNWWLSTGAPAG